MNKGILVCIDGKEHTKTICDSAVFFAKHFGVKVTLFHAIEYLDKHEVDFSENISLSNKEKFVKSMIDDDEGDAKIQVKQSKKLLQECKQYCNDFGIEVDILNMRGEPKDIIKNKSSEYKMVILGKTSSKSSRPHLKDIIQNIDIPMLVLGDVFNDIKTVLLAYDGGDMLKKSLNRYLESQSFFNKDMKYMVANLNKDNEIANKILKEAKDIFNYYDIDIAMTHVGGEYDSFVNFYEQSDADLLVLGAYNDVLKHIIFGSFANNMIEKSTKPILVFK